MKKKNLGGITITLFLLFICFSSLLFAETIKFVKHYSSNGRFSINLPENWEIKEEVGRVAVVANAPKDFLGRSHEIIMVSVEISNTASLEEHYRENLEFLRNNQTGFEEHEEGQLVIDGTEARWLVFSASQEAMKAKHFAVFFVKGNQKYLIMCMAKPEEFSKYKSLFEEVVQSFRFE